MARPGTLLAALALALAPLAGCAPGPPQEPLLVFAGPRAFELFELRDGAEEVIWRLVADRPVAVAALIYGRVPSGFRQEVPASGPPRPLFADEPLTITSLTEQRVFVHRGLAVESDGFSISRWETRVREGFAPVVDGDEPSP